MRKIDYAVGAASSFISHLHAEGVDRGMIASFGDTFRIEQNFTATESVLHSSLKQIGRSSLSSSTRLYDSIEDVIGAFWKYGRRDCPWILVVVTDGQDNNSVRFKNNASAIGRHVGQTFNHDPTNFPFLIGVGKDGEIDRTALGRIGDQGSFPAVAIDAFPLLERLFLRIAIDLSTRIGGQIITDGRNSYGQLAVTRQLTRTPIDYAFLIDRSASMSEQG